LIAPVDIDAVVREMALNAQAFIYMVVREMAPHAQFSIGVVMRERPLPCKADS
jgi:hypothetical protein